MNTAASVNDPPGSGGVRAAQRRRTDDRIAAAVLQLIKTSGPSAVTMEAVSALSGVAKTTLYRRYRDRYDLMAGVANQITLLVYPAAGLTRESFADVLRGLQEVFESRVGFAFVGNVLASEEDFIVSWREQIVKPRIDALHEFFARGIADGVLSPDVDYQLLAEFIMGGMVMCDALRGDVPDDWADDVVATIWPAIAVRP